MAWYSVLSGSIILKLLLVVIGVQYKYNIYNRNGISNLPDNPPILLLNAKILTSPVFIKWSGRIYIIIFIYDTQIQQQNL